MYLVLRYRFSLSANLNNQSSVPNYFFFTLEVSTIDLWKILVLRGHLKRYFVPITEEYNAPGPKIPTSLIKPPKKP